MYHSVLINILIVLLIESLLLLKKLQQLLTSQWKRKVSDTFRQTPSVPVTLPITFTLENLE